MKKILVCSFMFAGLLLISSGCNNAHENSSTTTPSSDTVNTKSEQPGDETQLNKSSLMQQSDDADKKTSSENNLDNRTTEEKEKYLKDNNLVTGSKDTQCNICSKRCCSPCLQNGDYKLCVQTRFENCSVCSHTSSRHSAVDHL
jgi:hypothetical protein